MSALTSEGFDRTKAVEAARHFQEATGVECGVIDSEGEPVSSGGTLSSTTCTLCRTLKALADLEIPCRQAHLYGSYQSMRFGGRYTYFCPVGLTHVCAPILADGRMVASFIGGPILLFEAAELLAELRSRHELGERQFTAVERAVRLIPQVEPSRARSLGELLLYAASYVSGANVQELAEEEEALSQEARISDYIHDLKSMGGDATSHYPAETEAELLETIRTGDRNRAQELLTELLATIRVTEGEDLPRVKARVLELVVLLSRAAIDGGAEAESVFGVNYRALDEIHSFQTVSQLTTWVTKIADRYVQFVFDVQSAGRSDVVIKALHAMRRKLGEKVGLEDIASEVNLSPAYFSRVFKEETGTSFSTRLNDLRIDKAKRLLRSTDRTIMEIALEVGFSDQSHFSRVFRDRTDSSPARYRNSFSTFTATNHEIH